MYDTRWPRPGPAMAALAALLGLVAGAVLGLSSPGGTPRAEAHAPVETTVAHATTTLPERFHTVILGSYDNRANAERRLRQVHRMGVGDAGILEQSEYDLRIAYAEDRLRQVRRLGVRDAHILSQTEYQLGIPYAVYSGVYATREEAMAHLQELAGYDIPPNGRFYREVTRIA